MRKIFMSIAIILGTVFINPLSHVSQSYARVIVKEKVKYYRVKGSTGAEIYNSMVKNGPDHGGNTKNVLASTSFTFDFTNTAFAIRKNRCVLSNVDIIINVTYTYPKWHGSKTATKETRRAWKKFEKIAILHEQEHVKITQKFASDYENILRKSRRRAANECVNVSILERIRSSFAIRKHERLHRRFDRRDLRRGGLGYEALVELVRAE